MSIYHLSYTSNELILPKSDENSVWEAVYENHWDEGDCAYQNSSDQVNWAKPNVSSAVSMRCQSLEGLRETNEANDADFTKSQS